MKDFLSNAGLYQVHKILENYTLGNENYTGPYDFVGVTFQYKCEFEDSIKTFELGLDTVTEKHYGIQRGDLIPSESFIDDKLNYTFKGIGRCKSCNDYHIYFLLNVFSNNPISNILDNINNISFSKKMHIK